MKRELKITIWNNGSCETTVDEAVVEFGLTIILDGRELATLLCSPDALEELTVGFLTAEGLVRASDDIASLHINMPERTATVRTGGGTDTAVAERLRRAPTITATNAAASATATRAIGDLSPITGGLCLAAETVAGLMSAFLARAAVFRATGGTHAAGLVLDGRITAFYEDIGRHNALDKVFGYGLRAGLDFGQAAVLSSGRVSSEVVLKAARIGLPILVSKSAPTADAVEAGGRLGVTVVGFVRGRRMNIYSAPERIGC